MEEKKAKLSLVMTMFIFGTIGIFVNYINLPTNIIAVVRGFVGAISLLLITKIKKEKISIQAISKNWKLLFFSGFLIGLNWVLLFEAYMYTSVAIATLCSYLAPIFMMLTSYFLFKEKLRPSNFLCVFVALLGMVFVSGVFETSEYAANHFKGVLFGVMTAICYTFVIFINKSIKDISPNDKTVVQLFIAGLSFLPYTLLSKNTTSISFDFLSIFLLLIVAVLHTGYSYSIYFNCVAKLKTQTVAMYSYTDPIVAIVLSTIILKQKMTLLSVIGAILILGSTMVNELLERRKK